MSPSIVNFSIDKQKQQHYIYNFNAERKEHNVQQKKERR